MYRIEKRFTLPIGHRLSKHSGRCFSPHGHNFTILVGFKAEKLNDNDMIEDFTNIKKWVGKILDEYDHTFLVNKIDESWLKPLADQFGFRTKVFDEKNNYDPTAERLAEKLFWDICKDIEYQPYDIDYVTVYENENSKATYSKE